MKKIIIFIVCYLIGTIVYAQTPADSVPLDYNGLRETVWRRPVVQGLSARCTIFWTFVP